MRLARRAFVPSSSWSWASVLTRVEYEQPVDSLDLELKDLVFAELIGLSCDAAGEDDKGELLSSTHMILRGKMVETELQQGPRLYRWGTEGCPLPCQDLHFDLSNNNVVQPSSRRRLHVQIGNKFHFGAKLHCLQIVTGSKKQRRT